MIQFFCDFFVRMVQEDSIHQGNVELETPWHSATRSITCAYAQFLENAELFKNHQAAPVGTH